MIDDVCAGCLQGRLSASSPRNRGRPLRSTHTRRILRPDTHAKVVEDVIPRVTPYDQLIAEMGPCAWGDQRRRHSFVSFGGECGQHVATSRRMHPRRTEETMSCG